MSRPRQASAPSVTVPTEGIKDPAVAEALHSLAESINGTFKRTTLSDTPTSHLVSSPNGSIYQLQVSDTGTVTSTLIKAS